MNKKDNMSDPDIIGSLPAMQRAFARAKRVARATNTPLIVMSNGKITKLKLTPKKTHVPKKRRAKPAPKI
ncbi:MAG: hypothetical protein M3O30_15950 [Planctomycetota bacterium]|nr:hypothetical protein [Planctomycetota bacterium]